MISPLRNVRLTNRTVIRSGLSGKQCDISMKALGKLGLTKVTKTDEGLTVEVAG
jgi:hypothetical protein